MSLNVCIFGVSGYTGSKLLYFLDKHKNVKVRGVFGHSSKGKKLGEILNNLKNISQLKISNYEDFNFDNVDLVFSCLPHNKFQNEIINNLNSKLSIIDLSGDFRFDSTDEYEKFYKCKHNAKEINKKFLYGLSEIYKQEITKSKFIANPGCYPTSILLPLIPLLREKKLDVREILVDSKSGISGAGKKLKVENLFSEISENFFSYGLTEHQHYPEIMQEFNKFKKNISFTFIPHVLPVISGIQSTIYLEKKFHEDEYKKTLSEFFANESFVKIYEDNRIPSIKDVRNTNNIAIKIFTDYSKRRIVILSCLDNLVKGASGQAIQNMNLMFNFDEEESLV